MLLSNQKCYHCSLSCNAYHWLTGDDGVEDATPGSCQKELDRSNVVVGGLGVDGAKGNGRCNDGNEKEEINIGREIFKDKSDMMWPALSPSALTAKA